MGGDRGRVQGQWFIQYPMCKMFLNVCRVDMNKKRIDLLIDFLLYYFCDSF